MKLKMMQSRLKKTWKSMIARWKLKDRNKQHKLKKRKEFGYNSRKKKRKDYRRKKKLNQRRINK